MKPEEFLPLLSREQEKLDKLKLDYNVRLNALEKKFCSNTNYKKNDDKYNTLDSKIEQLSKEKDKTISYYEDTLKNAERKYDEVRNYCMKQMELVRDKYDIKVTSLENKKEKQDNFDEENDLVLNKKKLEISSQENSVADYKAKYKQLLAESENRIKREAVEKEYIERKEQKIAEERKRQQAEQLAIEQFYIKADKEQEELEELEKRVEKYSLQLSKHKKELDKQLPCKLYNKYIKLSENDKIILLDKSLDYIIEYIS